MGFLFLFNLAGLQGTCRVDAVFAQRSQSICCSSCPGDIYTWEEVILQYHDSPMNSNRNLFFPSGETGEAASTSSRSKTGAKMDAVVCNQTLFPIQGGKKKAKMKYVPSISARDEVLLVGWAFSCVEECFSGRSSWASAWRWSLNARRCKNAVTEIQTYWHNRRG
jgi:hypothetical protein